MDVRLKGQGFQGEHYFGGLDFVRVFRVGWIVEGEAPALTSCTARRRLGGSSESRMVLSCGILSTSRMDCWVVLVAVAVRASTTLQGTLSCIKCPSRK